MCPPTAGIAEPVMNPPGALGTRRIDALPASSALNSMLSSVSMKPGPRELMPYRAIADISAEVRSVIVPAAFYERLLEKFSKDFLPFMQAGIGAGHWPHPPGDRRGEAEA